jgi:hypothetical protein
MPVYGRHEEFARTALKSLVRRGVSWYRGRVHLYPPPRADRWDPWVVTIVFTLLIIMAAVFFRF